MCVYINKSIFRERERNIYICVCVYTYTYIYKEIYFKELAHLILEADKFKICRVGQQTGDPERADVTVEVQRPSASRIPSCSGEVSILFCWMRPAHIMEGNLPYSVSPDLNVNLIQNTLTETSRIVFTLISGHHGPAKLT